MLSNVVKQIPGSRKIAQSLGLATIKVSGGRKFLLEMLPKYSIGAEIGVHLGEFSQEIIETVYPKELHLIDPWEHHTDEVYSGSWYGGNVQNGQQAMDKRYNRVCDRFAREMENGQVKIHREYSSNALQKFADNYFDWVYIDGNHLYEYVKQDLTLALAKTRPGGFIAGDDYTSGSWWRDGVKRAVNEFKKNQAVRLMELCNSQFVFCKRAAYHF